MLFRVATVFRMVTTMVMGRLVSCHMLQLPVFIMEMFSDKEHCAFTLGVRSPTLPVPRKILRNIYSKYERYLGYFTLVHKLLPVFRALENGESFMSQ
jgi:hypothetical protein